MSVAPEPAPIGDAPGLPTDRAEAERLDASDPLRGLRAAFEIPEPEPIYLDGNSLGRLPKATTERLTRLVRDEWGGQVVRGWDAWIELPTRVGDKIAAAFLGAGQGEVVIGDSTTVNLYRLADAGRLNQRNARQARPSPLTISD
jgi:kynureninase